MKRSVLLLLVSLFAVLFLISCEQFGSSNEVTQNEQSVEMKLEVTAPVFGERLKPGESYFIKYRLPNEVLRVNIALYEKSSFKLYIAKSIGNTGEIKWTVPTNISASDQYKILVYEQLYNSSNYAYSELFSIRAD
jgi:hypothetical protein